MNPVLRENFEVLFEEGNVLTVYFYLLVFLAPAAFGALWTQSLGEQMWRGSAMLLEICASAALALIVYFALRLANHEYASRRFKPLEEWLRGGPRALRVVARGRVAALLAHLSCLLLLSTPILVWAAAISHTPLFVLAAALALIFFYGFCYGVWGLAASVLWERERETRQFAIRCFTLVVVVAALAVYLPLDPVVYLLAVLGREEPAPFRVAGVSASAHVLHFAFHLALAGSGLVAHRWALKRVTLGHR
ncbi:MAG TPA: hypothetical protein VHP37_15800 [Burkholderiales bacterium]|nr:hypothetical protein [Burkholderiales bacterium]